MTISRYPVPTIDENGHLEVSQYSHVGNGWAHFTSQSLSASQDFIFVDFSDTTNYPHSAGSQIEFDEVRIHVAGSNTANYVVEVGFLENVDGTDGDFYPLFDVVGSLTAGTEQEIIWSFFPNGPVCSSSNVVTSGKSLNDTAFNTATNLASTLDPATADTPSGSGDLVIRVTVTAGNIIASVEASYHVH